MFGRMRPSSSSLDSLEMERPPPKILKDDSLSIYEATLMKLKLGSRREPSSSMEEAVDMESDCSTGSVSRTSMETVTMEHDSTPTCTSQLRLISADEEAMAVDSNCSSASVLSSTSSACQSVGDLMQQQSSNMSILYMFSRYSNARNAGNPPPREASTVSHGSVCASQTSSSCHSTGSSRNEHSQHECLGSF
ncbi:hypothetical protein Tsubulata_044301 [Turnera subulata]|uniref:Uncharacterized protein n=1 Tax=Turnera subulata TaxID=218843 RepID=A0A9Q0JCH9_9ROSI|nr:hypothetical protein Tsubulata_044301 [Turnera subulata]